MKASDSACELVAAQHIVFGAVKETGGIVDSTAASMDHHQMMLAEAKLHSVIQSVLNKNWERKTGKSANYLHDKIEKKMNKLVNKLIYGTTLVASDLNTMKKVLQEKYAVDFFTGDRGMLQQKLNNNIEENMKSIGLQVSDETYVKIMQTTLSELSLIEDKTISDDVMIIKETIKDALKNKIDKVERRILIIEKLEQLGAKNPQAKAIYNKAYSKYVGAQVKVDSKFLRHNAFHQFIRAVNVDNIINDVEENTRL